ncbi:transcriptional regulator GcvA [Agrobacterium pusense]|uniref:transcriptional regulator GcvA n=1 Tax=Agrobacterium TaxID=357 RepID=UPI001E300E5F|nr:MULTISPECIES: transcriptional regulator GcvA [Agrobacterium]
MAVTGMPPLNPLYVFEVAARHGGFGKAAQELNVTQSAVSRQISVLESYLGVRLFHRERTGSKLTEAGEEFAAEIAEPFAKLAAASHRLVERKPNSPLKLRAYATFASRWLIPRLSNFHKRYPKIQITVSNTVKPVDFSRETVEIAIQVGNGNWPGMNAIHLFDDVIQPVASPALLKRTPLNTPADLLKHARLHSYYRRRDWADWFAAAGVDLPDDRGTVFESSNLTYQAAIEGLGVAIGQKALLGEELASGKLVALFDSVKRPLAYYLVWPMDRPESRKLQSFRDWLLEETKNDPALR